MVRRLNSLSSVKCKQNNAIQTLGKNVQCSYLTPLNCHFLKTHTEKECNV